MILFSKYLVPRGYKGLTIFPFMFLKYRDLRHDKILINHERIHLRQQLELMILPFYIFYVFEFLIRMVHHKNWSLAYRNISFEREAYRNETNLDYIKTRNYWSFLNYF